MAEVRWSLAAERDLQALERYLARGSDLRAVVLVERLLRAAEILTTMPRLGRMVPEFGRPELRELLFRSYRVVYLLHDDQATVLRVTHGARDLLALVDREPWDLR